MDREKAIEELTNLPTMIYDSFYQLRITHNLRNKVIDLLKEQETKFICNLLGGQPYEVYCRECMTVVCQLSKDDTMDTVKRVFNFCPHCGREVKWDA